MTTLLEAPPRVFVGVGNTKLGQAILTWSIPAGRHATCPGETPVCAAECYGKSGFYCTPSVAGALYTNWQASLRKDFPQRLLKAIPDGYAVFRVHVSGDFYAPAYVRKWLRIVRARRDLTFFAYTRSWRVPEILPVLKRLAREPNMQLWWSADRDAPEPPRVPGVRIAYMAAAPQELDAIPEHVDLVFRTSKTPPRKRATGKLICPFEQGVPRKVKITCTNCGICWRSRKC